MEKSWTKMHFSLAQRFANLKKRVTLEGMVWGMMLGAISTLVTVGFIYIFLLLVFYERERFFYLLERPGEQSHGFEIGMSRLDALGVVKSEISERLSTQSGFACPNLLYYLTIADRRRCPNNPADVIKEVPEEEWEKEYGGVLQSDEWRWCTYNKATDHIKLYFENDLLVAIKHVPDMTHTPKPMGTPTYSPNSNANPLA